MYNVPTTMIQTKKIWSNKEKLKLIVTLDGDLVLWRRRQRWAIVHHGMEALACGRAPDLLHKKVDESRKDQHGRESKHAQRLRDPLAAAELVLYLAVGEPIHEAVPHALAVQEEAVDADQKKYVAVVVLHEVDEAVDDVGRPGEQVDEEVQREPSAKLARGHGRESVALVATQTIVNNDRHKI